ncbi:hypothetical protein D9M72_526540 [compost metagenome]
MRKPGARPGDAIAGGRDHALARRRHALRPHVREAQRFHHRLRIEGRRCPERHARDEPRRRHSVGSNPVKKSSHVPRQRRAVKNLLDCLEFLRIDIAVIVSIPDHADDETGAERHLHNRARLDRHAVGNRIGIGFRRRHGHQDRHDATGRNRPEQIAE